MSDTKPSNPQVFPIAREVEVAGRKTTHTTDSLSLRDWFAGRVASGMVTDKAMWGANPETMAMNAYKLAAALLKAREET